MMLRPRLKRTARCWSGSAWGRSGNAPLSWRWGSSNPGGGKNVAGSTASARSQSGTCPGSGNSPNCKGSVTAGHSGGGSPASSHHGVSASSASPCSDSSSESLRKAAKPDIRDAGAARCMSACVPELVLAWYASLLLCDHVELMRECMPT